MEKKGEKKFTVHQIKIRLHQSPLVVALHSNNIHNHHHREHNIHLAEDILSSATQQQRHLTTRLNNHNINNNHKNINENSFDSTNSVLSLVLPHDTYPGYSIKKFSSNYTLAAAIAPAILDGITSSDANIAVTHAATFRLMENEFSKYFTVLEDGTVMTTSDLSPLVNRPVHLTVLEENPLYSQKHQLELFVMDKKDMLRFPGATLESVGEVQENAKPGTKIHGAPLLQANSVSGVKPIDYTITSGNENGDFALENSKTGEIKTNITVYDVKKTGVWLVTNRPLDRELKKEHLVVIHATDEEGINIAEARITVKVIDENDNRPLFSHAEYRFIVPGVQTIDSNGNTTITWERFTKIGKVEAKDADGDKIAYKLTTPNNYVVIVPQTGELLLASEPEKQELTLEVEAHDIRSPSLTSPKPAVIFIEFVAPTPVIVQHMSHEMSHQHSHRRDKRRVTRAVRPTKRVDFTEADGDAEGRVVFNLEKETERETFKIRDENPWVTVETNGAVRVKKKWDFEELGPEKTIDFWVIITNQGGGHGVYG
uniref:CSON004045 protein n=1 Tax=Culicoides sonorensis TaxID=179676 RepID=A0A336L2Y6_CULSO